MDSGRFQARTGGETRKEYSAKNNHGFHDDCGIMINTFPLLSFQGLKSLLPYLKGRRVNITKEDLVNLLTNEDETKPPLLASFSPEAQSQLLPLPNGSCVLVINCQVDDGPEFCLHLVGWRGAASLRAYVPKQERMHYIRLCGGDVSKFGTFAKIFKALAVSQCIFTAMKLISQL